VNPVTRCPTEEDDVVIVEGTVRAQKASGEFLNLVFVDVFEMRNGKNCRLTGRVIRHWLCLNKSNMRERGVTLEKGKFIS